LLRINRRRVAADVWLSGRAPSPRVYKVSDLLERARRMELIVWAAFPAFPTLAVRPIPIPVPVKDWHR